MAERRRPRAVLWLVRFRRRLAAELLNSSVPVSESLPESFRLGHHDVNVGQLYLAAAGGRLLGHQMTDASQHLLFHGKDVGVDLPPIQSLLDRRAGWGNFTVHGLAPVAAANGGINVRSPGHGYNLFHPHKYEVWHKKISNIFGD